MWEHRNWILHHCQSLITSAVPSALNPKIWALFAKSSQYVLLAQWLKAMGIALLACRKNSDQRWQEPRLMMSRLQSWLSTAQR